MFENLIVELDPPPNRRGKCEGEKERHLTEAAVMLAYGLHLLATVPGLVTIELHQTVNMESGSKSCSGLRVKVS